MVKRGSVVLIKYPFTDLSGTKVRPAIIITPDKYLHLIDDVLCLFVSSVMRDEALDTDYIIDTNNPHFPASGLKIKSVLRTHKLALLDKSLVVKELGEVHPEIMTEVDKCLRLALGL